MDPATSTVLQREFREQPERGAASWVADYEPRLGASLRKLDLACASNDQRAHDDKYDDDAAGRGEQQQTSLAAVSLDGTGGRDGRRLEEKHTDVAASPASLSRTAATVQVSCTLAAAQSDAVRLGIAFESPLAVEPVPPPLSLIALPSEVLRLLVPGWGGADVCAAMRTCRVFNAAFAEAAAAGAAAVSSLEHLRRKIRSARTPVDLLLAGDGVHQRILQARAKEAAGMLPGTVIVRFVGGASNGQSAEVDATLSEWAHAWRLPGATAQAATEYSDDEVPLFDDPRRVDWTGTGVDSEGIHVAARAMCHPRDAPGRRLCDCLTKLLLSGNPIGDAGAAALAPVLSASRCLVDLELEDCRLRDTGTRTLAHALCSTDGAAAADGAKHASGATHGTTPDGVDRGHVCLLRRLCLGSNPIGDEGCVALAAALLHGPRLLTEDRRTGLGVLQLGDTDVGDRGADAIATALDEGAMPQGMQLWLASTRISVEGRARLMLAASPRAALRVCW